MDRPVAKKKWTLKRIATLAGILLLVALVTYLYIQSKGNNRLNVDHERISIEEVKFGAFQETIPINGVVMPITTIYLDAIEGGRVETLYTEDGAMLSKDQPILKLSNTDLELDLVNRETAVYDLITNMQQTKNLAAANSIQQLNQMAEVENALKEAERVYNLNKRLFDEKIISDQEFQSSQNLFNYQIRRRKLTEQNLRQDSLNTNEQLQQMKASVSRTQVALELMRKKAEDLVVKAPLAGQLTSLNAEIGQSINRGQRLGQLDVLTGFKVRADIDEHYVSRVFVGLTAEFSFSNKTYQLRVKKIYTQVSNGRFQVDMEFVNGVPEGIRRGQTLQIRLALSDETQALLLPRGGFYQQTGGNWIFKVNDTGTKAYRTEIQLGRQNPEYYEVLQGLQKGDKVVTSSYDNYNDMQELLIKK